MVEMKKPEPGMGCTVCLISDEHACTITRVSESGKAFWFTYDNSTIIKGSSQDGCAKYIFETVEGAKEHKATLRKDGRFREEHTGFFMLIGERREHYDPSF